MNLKQVNWKLILLSSIFMIIVMTIFGVIIDDLSLVSIISSALVFPMFGLGLSFEKQKFTPTKFFNEKTKIEYFESLFDFINTDLIFYNEQLKQLSEDEFEQYNIWLFDKKYPVFFEYKALSLIKTFEVIKPTNDMEKVGEMLILSTFGEYCPEKSLRGYKLSFLLKNKENYKPKLILQEGNLAIVS